jgi:hypothetical protein
VASQLLTTARREPHAEPGRDRTVETTGPHEVAARTCGRRRQQVCRVELLRDPVRLDEPGPAPSSRGIVAAATLLVAQHQPDLDGQPLDGLGEAQVLDLLQEREDVAALAAAVALVIAGGRVDRERRRLLVVEGAQTP